MHGKNPLPILPTPYSLLQLKSDGYGPIGNGGNGLILHSALGVSLVVK
jgi:hypothetical protein